MLSGASDMKRLTLDHTNLWLARFADPVAGIAMIIAMLVRTLKKTDFISVTWMFEVQEEKYHR